jgi:hypothetical protein
MMTQTYMDLCKTREGFIAALTTQHLLDAALKKTSNILWKFTDALSDRPLHDPHPNKTA